MVISNYGVEIGHGERGAVVLRVTGEIDSSVAGDLLDTILCAALHDDAGAVILDLEQVTFMDSSGLGALVKARQKVMNRDGTLIVINEGPSVRKVMALAGLDVVFNLDGREVRAAREAQPPR